MSILARWLEDLPALALLYLVAFGVRLGTFQTHGVVSSLWNLSQYARGVDDRLASIKGDTKCLPEIDERTKRLEANAKPPAKDDSRHLTIAL
jgi:hypothetical protein